MIYTHIGVPKIGTIQSPVDRLNFQGFFSFFALSEINVCTRAIQKAKCYYVDDHSNNPKRET
jgi:hypothetical protein